MLYILPNESACRGRVVRRQLIQFRISAIHLIKIARVIRPPRELLDLLKPYDRGIQELTIALRELVIEEMAPCCEYILEVYTIALHYGPTDKLKDAICYIGVIKDHVNLGFLHGSELADPEVILEGTGKQMRHIKIWSPSDLLRPAIRAYLREASERAGHEVAAKGKRTVTTVVKRKSLPRRSIGTTTVQ